MMNFMLQIIPKKTQGCESLVAHSGKEATPGTVPLKYLILLMKKMQKGVKLN